MGTQYVVPNYVKQKSMGSEIKTSPARFMELGNEYCVPKL
jgi:hypothetical protein